MQHHEDAIARYVARVSPDPDVLGVIITGSLARGRERVDSDVDLYLLVTDAAWDRAFAAEQLSYSEDDGAGYDHGYYDIKLATLSYLDDAAERGDDPVRDSFAHSRIVYSEVDDLADRLARVAEVPEGEWEARAASFIAQARLHGDYFLRQGEERGDPLLVANASTHLALAVGRALLALNHERFQGPKYLFSAVSSLPRKPEGIRDALAAAVERPGIETGSALLELTEGFTDWGMPREQTLSRFILDNELAWRYRTKPPEYS